ncbi:hypothetical protein [Streptomyces olivaceiscleroticus]|uniref:Methyltransferase n=1 Tax=Streptomyces olivaceiscleroticus TaxID=68245 RepID=A0ABN1BL56_9ACTN
MEPPSDGAPPVGPTRRARLTPQTWRTRPAGPAARPAAGRFDEAVRRYLRDRPQATVVALGEGLDPGFWRVDNGQLRWLTVEEPATAALRRMLLPDGPRWRTLTGRATAPHWPAAVARPALGVLVLAFGPPPAAEGLQELCALCARRLPGSTLLLDAPLRHLAAAVDDRPGVRTLHPPGARGAGAPTLAEFRFGR